MWITAYLGEVIRRETGATWYDYEDRPMLDCGDYQADPMTAVVEFFEQRQGLRRRCRHRNHQGVLRDDRPHAAPVARRHGARRPTSR